MDSRGKLCSPSFTIYFIRGFLTTFPQEKRGRRRRKKKNHRGHREEERRGELKRTTKGTKRHEKIGHNQPTQEPASQGRP
jgi:hypothetical protein